MTNVVQHMPQTEIPSTNVATPLAMIERAVSSGASIETLERLMALQERWEAAEAKKEFDHAISEAKASIKPVRKNRHVGFESKKSDSRTDYDYEDFAAVAEMVDPVLTQHGLSYRYTSKQDGTMVSVTCIIAHKRGHQEATTLQAAADTSGNKNHVQAIGSTVTYLQRYTLKLALGIAATRDSDGNIPQQGPKLIDDAQFRYIKDMMEKASADETKFCAFMGVEKIEDMTQEQYKRAESALRARIAKKEAANAAAQ